MTLDQAIFDFVSGIESDLHWGRAPSPAADLPYGIMDPLSGAVIEYDSEHTATENVTLRLHIWDSELDAVRSRMLALEEGILFHEGDISLANAKVLSITKSADELMLDPDRDAEGDEVWHGVIDFVLLVARTPGF